MEQSLIVSADWLQSRLGDPDVCVIDCRFVLGQPDRGAADYQAGHIPGALYFHLEQDLSGPVSPDRHGGRHPLPDVRQLAERFSAAGIDERVTVVAYDSGDLAMAARLWWLLRYLGHERAAVLDGGFAAWVQAGLPVSQDIAQRPRRTFVPRLKPEMLASVDDVKNRSDTTALLDSRARERYLGEAEHIDPKAGHIPGALHCFYRDNLTPDGTMKPADELRTRFAPLAGKDQLIVYCGSGVTACVNVLALHLAGRTDARLYAGSWSDWCSYDLPVATGEEPGEW